LKRKLLSILLVATLILSFGLLATPVMAEDVGVEGVVYENYLTLDNKTDFTMPDGWNETPGDGIGGTLGYNSAGPTFEWGLEATGIADGDYALIYYADYPGDRFDEWGGDNPGVVISTMTVSGNAISTSGSAELGMDLPCAPDANKYFYDYSGDPDNYAHAHGAKIWLVPASALDGGSLPVTAWPPDDNWLFETDLITYDDTDVDSGYVVSISVAPTTIDFGMLSPGQSNSGGTIEVTNTGGLPVNVTVELPADGLFSNILFDANAYGTRGIAVGATDTADVSLDVPGDQAPGDYSGTIVFWAEAAQ
jgi:hypothetical protein